MKNKNLTRQVKKETFLVEVVMSRADGDIAHSQPPLTKNES